MRKPSCVIEFISNEEQKRFGYNFNQSDAYPVFAYKTTGFHYKAENSMFIPNYMIRKTYDLKKARELFPEMFL